MRGFRRFLLVVAGALLVVVLAGVASAAGGNALTNGDFETGSIAPWTAFTTANGTNGAGLPDVVSFDTTGNGASLAAHFNVGEVSFTDSDYEGGGIYQNFYGSGPYTLSADIATHTSGGNASCGRFELLFDGSVVDSHDFGGCASGAQTLRFHLSGGVNTSPVPQFHQVEVLITRPFLGGAPANTDEYVDNISAVRKLTKAS